MVTGQGGRRQYAEPVAMFLNYMLIMNVSLAIFNLMPFPPLDGSKVLYTILPRAPRPCSTRSNSTAI